MYRGVVIVVFAVLCGACGTQGSQSAAPASGDDPAAHRAHEAYVAAINSNNLDTLLGVLTEDVVFLAPQEPVMVGKAAVRPWLEGYLKAFKTHWDKPVQEFVVNGDGPSSDMRTSPPTHRSEAAQSWRTRGGDW